MNKRVLTIILLLLLCLSFAQGAKIRGAIYDHTLDPISKSVIFINSSPEQTRVSQYGGYHFIVEPGSYEIRAELTRNGITKEIAQEYVTISSEGDFTKDLFLYDDFDMASEFEETSFTRVTRFFENGSVVFITTLIITSLLLGFFLYYVYSRKRKPYSEEPLVTIGSQTNQKEVLSDEEHIKKKIHLIIQKEKQITQKALRKKFSFSESKMSLILSEMEKSGLLERKKKGRVNVIVLGQSKIIDH